MSKEIIGYHYDCPYCNPGCNCGGSDDFWEEMKKIHNKYNVRKETR